VGARIEVPELEVDRYGRGWTGPETEEAGGELGVSAAWKGKVVSEPPGWASPGQDRQHRVLTPVMERPPSQSVPRSISVNPGGPPPSNAGYCATSRTKRRLKSPSISYPAKSTAPAVPVSIAYRCSFPGCWGSLCPLRSAFSEGALSGAPIHGSSLQSAPSPLR
jgi:hypothetical protein